MNNLSRSCIDECENASAIVHEINKERKKEITLLDYLFIQPL
jgi:hypothetical protein